MFRSRSCSQSISQNFWGRVVARQLDVHQRSEVHVDSSQRESNSTTFNYCSELRSSQTQCWEPCFHRVTSHLRHKTCCALSRDWVYCEVTVHEQRVFFFYNVFLPSEWNSFAWFPDKTSCMRLKSRGGASNWQFPPNPLCLGQTSTISCKLIGTVSLLPSTRSESSFRPPCHAIVFHACSQTSWLDCTRLPSR